MHSGDTDGYIRATVIPSSSCRLQFQELQQDRTRKQLSSPLPFPTTLPLLSASIAPSKTVIVDPITYLQSVIKEMLNTIVSVQRVPDYTGNLHLVVTLRYIQFGTAMEHPLQIHGVQS